MTMTVSRFNRWRPSIQKQSFRQQVAPTARRADPVQDRILDIAEMAESDQEVEDCCKDELAAAREARGDLD